jgi:hypothetical protein
MMQLKPCNIHAHALTLTPVSKEPPSDSTAVVFERLQYTPHTHTQTGIHAHTPGIPNAPKELVWKRPGKMSKGIEGRFITHFRLAGPPEGRLVVCIHAMGTSSFFFDGLAYELAGKGFLVLQYDLMGMGYSKAA